MLDPYLFDDFAVAETFFCRAFSSEGDQYPKYSEKNEKNPRMPAHLNDRGDGCIDLKSSCFFCRGSDDIFYKWVHHWSTDNNKGQTMETLFPAEEVVFDNTRCDDTSSNKKYSEQ